MWQLRPIFNDFFNHPCVGDQSMYGVPWKIFQSLRFTEDVFSFMPSLKSLRLSGYKMSQNILWQPSESSKVVLFLLPLFQSGTTLKSIKLHNSNTLCIPWNKGGVKWCWQQQLLLRVSVLCQITLEEEGGIARNDIYTDNHMSICAHTCTFQNTTVCIDSLQKINFKNFLWVIS